MFLPYSFNCCCRPNGLSLRLLIEERIAYIGIPLDVFAVCLFWYFFCFLTCFGVLGSLQTSLLCIVVELVWGGSVAAAVSVCDRCHMTSDKWQVISDKWHVKLDRWQVTGLFYGFFGVYWLQSVYWWSGDMSKVTGDRWNVTHDRWHMTADTWQVTRDMWHMIFFLEFF